MRDYGLPEGTAEPLGLNGALTAYYEDLAARTDDPRAAANWVMGELSAHLNTTGLAPEESPVTPARLAGLVQLVADGTLGSAGGKQVFAALVEHPDRDAAALVDELGLGQIADEGALGTLVDEVIAAHPDEAATYRGGKQALLGFFVGQVMKQSGGRAEPKAVQQLLREKLGS